MTTRNRILGGLGAAAIVFGAVAGGLAASRDDGAGGTSPAAAGIGAPREPVTERNVALATAAGKAFLDDYVDPDGRVVRRDQDDDTVSEGQAYGMMVAVAVDDRRRFQRIWEWTQEHLQRPDKLLAFQWADGEVTGPNPATDADLDAGRALLIAAERWDQPAYRADALELGESILLRETVEVSKRKYLVAGPWARKSPAVVNPSYFSPRAYDAFHDATGDRRWLELQETGLETIDGLTQNAPSLPPDWARVHGTEIVPSYVPSDPSVGVRYGYEATRVLPRYAEMCAVDQPDPDSAATPIGRRLASRAWPWMQTQGADGPSADYRPDGRRVGGNRNAVASVAAAAAADASGDTEGRDRMFAAGERTQAQTPTYYGSAWLALGRIMLTTDLLGTCGTPGAIA